GSSLGSNTTHCVPRYRLSSRKSAVRRTGMYFHSEARRSLPCRVREPHATGRKVVQLIVVQGIGLAQSRKEQCRVLALGADVVLGRAHGAPATGWIDE